MYGQFLVQQNLVHPSATMSCERPLPSPPCPRLHPWLTRKVGTNPTCQIGRKKSACHDPPTDTHPSTSCDCPVHRAPHKAHLRHLRPPNIPLATTRASPEATFQVAEAAPHPNCRGDAMSWWRRPREIPRLPRSTALHTVPPAEPQRRSASATCDRPAPCLSPPVQAPRPPSLQRSRCSILNAKAARHPGDRGRTTVLASPRSSPVRCWRRYCATLTQKSAALDAAILRYINANAGYSYILHQRHSCIYIYAWMFMAIGERATWHQGLNHLENNLFYSSSIYGFQNHHPIHPNWCLQGDVWSPKPLIAPLWFHFVRPSNLLISKSMMKNHDLCLVWTFHLI